MPQNESLQSVRRVVQILYAVAASEEGRTINQIAGVIGVKPNTAYRFIRTLEQEQMLHRKTNPIRYTLGEAVAELNRLGEGRHLLTIIGDVLVRTQSKLTNGSFVFCEAQGADVYQRLCVDAIRPGVLLRRRDFKLDFYTQATSLLILAYTPSGENERFYRAHPFETAGIGIWKTRENLELFLEKIRRTKQSMPGFPVSNLFRLAVPIFNSGNEIIGAIGGYISMNESSGSKKQLIQLVHTAAGQIMESLK